MAALERGGRSGPYRPRPLPLWRLPDALARLRRLLPDVAPEGGAPLGRFLPEVKGDGPGAALQRRAALASTLLAGLELCRDGSAAVRQEHAFGPVLVAPAATSSR